MLGAKMSMDLNFRTIEDLADVIASYTHNVTIHYEKRHSTRKAMSVKIGFGMSKQYVEFDGFESGIDSIDLGLFYELDRLVQTLEDKGVRVELVDVNTVRQQQPKTTRQRPRW